MSAHPRRVLIVEDDATLRDVLAEVLGDQGYEVRVGSHGREALKCLDGWDPHLIVLDLMMPVMDAYEFRDAQQSRDLASRAKTLVVSAAPDVREAASRLGADAWIAKPFQLGEMLTEIDRLLAVSG